MPVFPRLKTLPTHLDPSLSLPLTPAQYFCKSNTALHLSPQLHFVPVPNDNSHVAVERSSQSWPLWFHQPISKSSEHQCEIEQRLIDIYCIGMIRARSSNFRRINRILIDTSPNSHFRTPSASLHQKPLTHHLHHTSIPYSHETLTYSKHRNHNSPHIHLQMDKLIPQLAALTVAELQHELRKRGLMVTGIKKDLRERVMKALESEYADGWTLGYLLNTKIVPFSGRGRDPKSLVGRHVTGLGEVEDNAMAIMFSDLETQTIVCQASDADDRSFSMGQELYDLFCKSNGEERTYEKRPLLVTEAATALCKNPEGVVVATIGTSSRV